MWSRVVALQSPMIDDDLGLLRSRVAVQLPQMHIANV